VHVRVEDPRLKANLRRDERILLGDIEDQFKGSILIGCIRWALIGRGTNGSQHVLVKSVSIVRACLLVCVYASMFIFVLVCVCVYCTRVFEVVCVLLCLCAL
jgi:hypothetical protein